MTGRQFFSSPATLRPKEIHESALPESNIPPELDSFSLTPQLLTEEVGQGIQVAFEIHLVEIQEIDQSHVLDLQYTNYMQTSYLKGEDSNDGNGSCYGPHENTAQQPSYDGRTIGLYSQT